ncbi:dual specificity protein phosphatase 22 isoform X3 [Macaca nemestrina]|uniref:dual specificity protein phosphatase 22 isoform X3 n=1 Tax=Macaca nemestrina TaxID=9545 RepID=UPI0039B9937F
MMTTALGIRGIRGSSERDWPFTQCQSSLPGPCAVSCWWCGVPSTGLKSAKREAEEGVKYLCIPAADSPSQNLTRHFKESIKFIHECRLRGESCLVHCLAGVSRSVTLVIAYIMTVTDFGWEDALHTVRAGRSCANPNVGFQRQLQEFEKHEVHQYRQWLREEYGESPLPDAEEAKSILAAPGILKYWAFLRRL